MSFPMRFWHNRSLVLLNSPKMAWRPYSLLLHKRLTRPSINSRPTAAAAFLCCFPSWTVPKTFSTEAQSPSTPSSSSSAPKPSSLSARMSFIFDQIDAIERERSQKDETLQRIRAWRESKKQENQENETRTETASAGEVDVVSPADSELGSGNLKELEATRKKEVELVHPWPEWIELMERLVQQNYFDHRRKDEDKMMQEMGIDPAQAAVGDDVGVDFTKDFDAVKTACLNFGKDRFDIMRSLKRQDIQILVGFGCPNTDRKVAFSGKLLRKLVHLDEGDVCSSCSLRNSCKTAYLTTNKEDEARTTDVMRILLTFGFHPITGTVVNDSVLKQKSVKNVVRKLLHEVVKLSAAPIDPNLPPPVIRRPPPKVKQPPPPPRKRVGRDDVEMKKGDWLCPKCDFMNFAKNTTCLQCDAKRPKRQLLPGEWECPKCNFLNYRRNMVCFHCECKRPADDFTENRMQEKQAPRTRLEKAANREEVSNAWNFDFDDDESDGADVAAFEYADSSLGQDSHINNQELENSRGFQGNFDKVRRGGLQERGYPENNNNRPGIGFDDFDDEEDDIDNYEIDTYSNAGPKRTSSVEFSDVESYSGSEDVERSSSYKNSRRPHRKPAFSSSRDGELDSDSDEELSGWKSSHVATSRQRGRGRGGAGPSRRLSYGSDEAGLYSDADNDFDDGFRSRQQKGKKRRDSQRRRGSDIEDMDMDDYDRHPRGDRLRGNQRSNSGRGNRSQAPPGKRQFTRDDDDWSSNSIRGGRRNNLNNDFDKSSRGSRGGSRRFEHDRGGRRSNDRGGDAWGSKPRRHEYNREMEGDYGDFRNSRRVIER